jgi:hypothetical protein
MLGVLAQLSRFSDKQRDGAALALRREIQVFQNFPGNDRHLLGRRTCAWRAPPLRATAECYHYMDEAVTMCSAQ